MKDSIRRRGANARRGTAVVLGAGIAGVLAASVLSRHYAEVIILERDRVPDRPIDRKGVPQGRHPHILLRRGEEVIRRLVPGALERLRPRDFTPMDVARELRWFHAGVWKARHDPGFVFHTCNRVRLEHSLRAAVLERANVELRERHKILDLALDDAGRVRGVVVVDERAEVQRTIAADVVVDATGRSTRAPRWLAEHGFGEVPIHEVHSNVGYTTRVFHVPGGNHDLGLPIAVFPDPPRSRRAGIAFPLGDNGVSVVLAGWCRDYVPRSAEGFLEFARSLDRPELADLLARARPTPDQHTFRAKANLWRRYDRLRRWPDGLVVIGDAVTSLNPMYGQGMTIAAVEAETLARTLTALARRGARLEGPGRARRLQRAIAGVVRFPWALVTSEDLRHPGAVGPRPRGLALVHAVTSALHQLVAYDRYVHRRMFEILNLMRGPLCLLHPRVLLRVVLHRLRGADFLRVLRQASAPLVLADASAAAELPSATAEAAPPLASPRPSPAANAVMKPASLTFAQWRSVTRDGKLVQLRHAAYLRQLAARVSAGRGAARPGREAARDEAIDEVG
ncbi:MAG: FAD-dependent monooxygenase [Nannocystaceae bacterium]